MGLIEAFRERFKAAEIIKQEIEFEEMVRPDASKTLFLKKL